jgi:hypothetical protein
MDPAPERELAGGSARCPASAFARRGGHRVEHRPGRLNDIRQPGKHARGDIACIVQARWLHYRVTTLSRFWTSGRLRRANVTEPWR